MSMDIKLQQKLTQQMVMTPQLQQAIKLLQMSTLELDTFIEQELLENPTLETIDDSEDNNDNKDNLAEALEHGPLADQEKQQNAKDQNTESKLLSEVGAETPQEPRAQEMLKDMDWENYADSLSYSLPATAGQSSNKDDYTSFEAFVTAPTSLQDHLEWQIQVNSTFSVEEKSIALRILGDMNEQGYLPEDIIDNVSQEATITPEFCESILYKMQALDPLGVCARNLSECLTIQARQLDVTDPLVYTIIDNHLTHASRNMLAHIAKSTGYKIPDVEQALKIIASLEPRPARNFSDTPPEYIKPDIYIYRTGDEFTIVVDASGNKRLRVGTYYKNMVEDKKNEAKGYLQERFNRARWLVKSLFHRERTLYRVMESILHFQDEFFKQGDSKVLKPLVLRDVADELGVNESTISRATSNKYVSTPHGIFPLKFFFNTSISRFGNEDMASEGVREHIRKMIAEENPKKPLSDQKIVSLLKENDISIARRTVAKYREMMGIQSSSARKKSF